MSGAQRTDPSELGLVIDWANAHAREGDDWNTDSGLLPSRIRMTGHPSPFVLYATKMAALLTLFNDELLPDTALVVRYWPTPAWNAQVVSDLAQRHGNRVRFVGDLDPLDLLTFCSLGTGLADDVRLEYVGVGDRWLQCLRLERCLLSMTPFERLLWHQVRGLFDWTATLGSDAVAMLDGGEKVETDGAMNPRIQPDDVLESIRTDLLRG